MTPIPSNPPPGGKAPKAGQTAPPAKERKPAGKGGRGRPPALTPEVAAIMLGARRTGMPEVMLGPLCNLDGSIVGQWKKRGEREGKGIYYDFFIALEAAKPKFILANLEIIRRARDRNYRAAVDLLRLTMPEMFPSYHRLAGEEGGAPIPVKAVKGASKKERAAAIKRIMDAGED